MPDHARSLLAPPPQAQALKAASVAFASHTLRPDQLLVLELLLAGALPPLAGYLGRADFENVLTAMRLRNGRLLPWPVSLDLPEALGAALAPGDYLALRDAEGFMPAVLTVREIWPSRPDAEARALFDVPDPALHPGAAAYRDSVQPVRVAGEVVGLALPFHADFAALRQTPAQLKARLAQRGWRAVLACPLPGLPFLTDQAAIRQAAAACRAQTLLIRPVGEAMAGGAAHFTGVRCAMHCAAAFPDASALLALSPLPQPGAGPRQALFEALIHRALGASHTLVAPDQNDPGAAAGRPLYPLGAAQKLVAAHAAETGVIMVPARPMVFNAAAGRVVPADAAPPGESASPPDPAGWTRCLQDGRPVPAGCALPEVIEEMRSAYPPRSQQGFALFLTGLSGAGKSTLAKILCVAFMERRARPVTLLDGDIVRQRLSSELTFSREHRNLNILRIGYVASEIVKNGGIAICAPIAPYASSRRAARKLTSQVGGFVEIHMATPLAVCEQRDRKGLYAKARAGLITGVTGIDDPYETPEQAELTLDAAVLSPDEAARIVLRYLEKQGYLT